MRVFWNRIRIKFRYGYPDLCIRIWIITVGSGSVWRDTDPDPGGKKPIKIGTGTCTMHMN